MTDWKEYKFSDFVIINPTISLNGKEEYSYVEMKDLQDGNKFCFPNAERKPASGARFQDRDTLFAKITPCLENGKICQVRGLKNGIGFGSTEFFVFRGKENISDNDFVFYLSRWDEVRGFAEGNFEGTSGRQRVPKNCFDNLLLDLPDYQEQTAIATILSSLDNKIDLLHRQNKTLEQLAETLFRQWFVEEAEDSWKVVKIEDVCTRISSGGTPSTKMNEYYNGHINWYSTKELQDNFLFESISKITYAGLENSSAKLFPENTIIIAIYAAPTVGRLGILSNEATFNQAACGFVTDEEKICFEYLYLHLLYSRRKLNDMASGSAQQNLNVGIMKEFGIILPPEYLMQKFRDHVRPFFKKIKLNATQIRILTQLRDTLLPKLMSGEVGVKM
ncbi:MAG: restriction endonuclease subunit S [Bacteroidales bacterium]